MLCCEKISFETLNVTRTRVCLLDSDVKVNTSWFGLNMPLSEVAQHQSKVIYFDYTTFSPQLVTEDATLPSASCTMLCLPAEQTESRETACLQLRSGLPVRLLNLIHYSWFYNVIHLERCQYEAVLNSVGQWCPAVTKKRTDLTGRERVGLTP